MCWFGKNKDVKFAEENTTVFKVFYKNQSLSDKRLYSPLMGFKYKTNELYTTKPIKPKLVIVGEDCIKINEGLHSFSPNVTIKKYKYVGGTVSVGGYSFSIKLDTLKTKDHYIDGKFKLTILKCIIPKGTTYYENEDKEIVSDKLIVTDEEEYCCE